MTKNDGFNYESMTPQKRRYNLCPECGQPMLRRGQKRKHPDDYRHANGCPNDAPLAERNKEDK